MGKGTSRKSISVKGLTYQRIGDYLVTLPPPPPGEKPLTKSGFLELLIQERLGDPTDQECRKFAELEIARVSRQEVDPKPSPPPTVSEPQPSEPQPNPGSMPRGPLPEFSENDPPQRPRPRLLQPKKLEPVVREDKDDDPDEIPPAIRYF